MRLIAISIAISIDSAIAPISAFCFHFCFPQALVLQLAQLDQVLDPLLRRLHVAVEHGRVGVDAEASGRCGGLRTTCRRGPCP